LSSCLDFIVTASAYCKHSGRDTIVNPVTHSILRTQRQSNGNTITDNGTTNVDFFKMILFVGNDTGDFGMYLAVIKSLLNV